MCNPTQSANSSVALLWHAQTPHPGSAMRCSSRFASASLSSRVLVAGKCAMTIGSALSAANGSRSAALHCLNNNLGVSISRVRDSTYIAHRSHRIISHDRGPGSDVPSCYEPGLDVRVISGERPRPRIALTLK